VAVWVRSTCGRQATVVAGRTRVAATVTPTVSTRCLLAVRRNMERVRGTLRSVRRHLLQRTAVERTIANARLYVAVMI